MSSNDYLDMVTSRLSSHYDLTADFDVGPLSFNLAAKYVLRNERYIFSRQVATLDSCHNNTLCLVKLLSNRPEPEDIREALSNVVENMLQLVNPHEEHMSTTINLVLVTTEPVDPETAKLVQDYRFYKSFAWGFHGWCHIGIVLVSLFQNAVYANKVGKGVVAAFHPSDLKQSANK